ncbi:rap GTPase-activating protein, putative [Entamoeba dispar SAW760]|uniref:Rap GTPase-activating protein, putative n=1 Tax=Entamoeba dispar (strain ATCC PRA-260 / SAW760) TaxID=370354 RepID=B0EDL4_ENTDS|nr:rap GTPase-activating protein, putative [Entamoeba dispar SAW760]EDR27377.1 rap GTPase-activating protein, putative [Entamoeba dispar SAW760]|eukprot:EDR27377.1 rap GTPase-activating protein, putative [Entamoeba dispar SAW760]
MSETPRPKFSFFTKAPNDKKKRAPTHSFFRKESPNVSSIARSEPSTPISCSTTIQQPPLNQIHPSLSSEDLVKQTGSLKVKLDLDGRNSLKTIPTSETNSLTESQIYKGTKEVKSIQKFFGGSKSSEQKEKESSKTVQLSKISRRSFINLNKYTKISSFEEEGNQLISNIQDALITGFINNEKEIEVIFSNQSIPVYSSLIPNLVYPNKRLIKKQSAFKVLIDSSIPYKHKTYDCWSSLLLPEELWIDEVYHPFNIINEDLSPNYHIESNSNSISNKTDLSQYEVINIDDNYKFFKELFFSKSQTQFYVFRDNVTILCYQRLLTLQFIIIFNNKGIHRVLLTDDDECYKWWQTVNGFKEKPIRVKPKIKFQEELLLFESKLIVTEYKFGVIYMKKNQRSEEEAYENNECSPAFWKFMNLIGTKKQLKGWQNYSGGLDIINGKTGEFMYYQYYDKFNFEIVYHVAPLLPYYNGEEQLERKRFIGNDIVVIIFKEQSDEHDCFDPRVISSSLNHIFIVITPERNDVLNERYKINVVCKSCIKPFPPFIEDKWYYHSIDFSDFLIRKLINGDRTAITCSPFIERMIHSNERLLKHVVTSSL